MSTTDKIDVAQKAPDSTRDLKDDFGIEELDSFEVALMQMCGDPGPW